MTAADIVTPVFTLLALALLALALLPEIPTTWWLIRAMDVPRVQAFFVALALLLLAPFLPATPWIGIAALGATLLWQGTKIVAYTPVAQKEVQLADSGEGELKLMAWNVLMENDDHEAAVEFITRESPDILLLMETDETWENGLKPVLDGYSTVIRHPRDNYYGMIFATRLPAGEARIVYLTEDETPSVLAELAAPGGQRFRFVGLHPRPPVPDSDTDERDRQMLFAARFARKTDVPLISMGDFNAAAWSRASQHFKKVGEFIDPRVGRGLVASFDARSRLLRCPIDQLYITPDVAMTGFHRGPALGSDHFPMIATIRLDPSLAARLNRAPPRMDDEARQALGDAFASYGERLSKRHDALDVPAAYRPMPGPEE